MATKEEESRMKNLAKANKVRSFNSRKLKQLRMGRITPEKFLNDPKLASIRVGKFLANVPIGKARSSSRTSAGYYGIRVRRIMNEADFSPYRRIGSLSPPYKTWLLAQVAKFPYYRRASAK